MLLISKAPFFASCPSKARKCAFRGSFWTRPPKSDNVSNSMNILEFFRVETSQQKEEEFQPGPNTLEIHHLGLPFTHFTCTETAAVSYASHGRFGILLNNDRAGWRYLRSTISASWISFYGRQLLALDSTGQIHMCQINVEEFTISKGHILIDSECCWFSHNDEILLAIPRTGPGLFCRSMNTTDSPVLVLPQCTFIDCAVGPGVQIAVTDDGSVRMWGSLGGNLPQFKACRCWAGSGKAYLLSRDNILWVKDRISDWIPIGHYGTIVNVAFSGEWTVFLNTSGDLFTIAPGEKHAMRREGKGNWVVARGGHAWVGMTSTKVKPPKPIPKHCFLVEVFGSLVDIGDHALAAIGVKRDDIYSRAQRRVIGVDDDGNVVVRERRGSVGSCRIVFSESDILQNDVSEHALMKTPSQAICVDKSERACRAFGVLAGETLYLENDIVVRVAGVYGAGLWVHWSDKKHEMSETVHKMAIKNVLDIHAMIRSVETIGRKVEILVLPDGQRIVCETEPCRILESFGLRTGDFVRYGEVIARVVGCVGYSALLKRVFDGEYIAELPCNLSVAGRESAESVIVTMKGFDETFVDVDVSYSNSDKFQPLDRVATTCGVATVMGKDTKSGLYFIQTDDATALNAGVILLEDPELAVVVRRLSNVEHEDVMLGDYIRVGDRDLLVVGKTADEWLLRDIKTGNSETLPIHASTKIEIILREGFPCFVRPEISATLSDFRGFGLKPGDRFDFDEQRRAVVVGRRNEHVILKIDGEEELKACCASYFFEGGWQNIDRLTVDTSKFR